ncbi:MAG TPA: YceI family protein [Burkholderiales bacterium]
MNKALALVALLAAAAAAHAADWKSVPAGSKLEIVASFEKTPVPGEFKQFDARLKGFDPQKGGGSLDVVIQTASADMGVADVNREIRGKDWFDMAAHPKAEFHSSEIRREGNRWIARGTLALKGAKQPVDVPFAWTPSGDGATMEGEFTVKRGAFGIGAGEWASSDTIGADVKVRFKVRMAKGG